MPTLGFIMSHAGMFGRRMALVRTCGRRLRRIMPVMTGVGIGCGSGFRLHGGIRCMMNGMRIGRFGRAMPNVLGSGGRCEGCERKRAHRPEKSLHLEIS